MSGSRFPSGIVLKRNIPVRLTLVVPWSQPIPSSTRKIAGPASSHIVSEVRFYSALSFSKNSTQFISRPTSAYECRQFTKRFGVQLHRQCRYGFDYGMSLSSLSVVNRVSVDAKFSGKIIPIGVKTGVRGGPYSC